LVRLAVIACGALAAMSGAAVTSAQQSYPPREVIITTQALGCNATQVIGTIDGAAAGSQVTLQLIRPVVKAGFGPLKQQTDAPVVVTANAANHADFIVPLPAGVYGTFTLTATGLKSDQSKFSISSTLNVTPCPDLPKTGNDNVQQLVTIGGLALLGGIFLVVLALRRRQIQEA